jgi:hypothetical protein
MRRRARVGRLENSPNFGGASFACPGCGVDPTAPVRYKLLWDEPSLGEAEDDSNDDSEAEVRVSSEPCSVCGARERTVLDWDGLLTDKEEAKEEAERIRRLERERAEYLKSRTDLYPSQDKEAKAEVPNYPPWSEANAEGGEVQ